MDPRESLLELERPLWNADEDFYRIHLAEGAVMVFPAPTGILERTEILDSVGGGDRWQTVEFGDERFVRLGDGAVQLIYDAVAVRVDDGSEYGASITSTYVQEDGSWKIISHQQTPTDG